MTRSPQARRNHFVEHSTWDYPLECRSRAGSRRNDRPAAFTLEAIINRENLVQVFERRRNNSGQGVGIDGFSYDDFSTTEFGDVADVAVTAIHGGRWRPRPARQQPIPKDSGGDRILSLRCILDRTISAAIAEQVTPRIDPLLGTGCFGFRPGRCVHGMLAEIAYRAESEELTVITQDDIKDAFPSVIIEHAVEDYSRTTIDPRLLRLIEVVLRGHDKSRQVGIDQGDPLSPPTLNLRLHYCLDLPALGSAGPGTTHRYRYVDNLVYQSRSVTEGYEALRQDRALLEQAVFQLKGKGNHPIDLQRQGARINILGFDLSWKENRVQFGLNQKAIRKLEGTLERVQEGPYPVETAREVIQGWIEAQGPAFESGGVCQILDRIQDVAARAGFREVGARVELEDRVESALYHWNQTREKVVQRSQGQDAPESVLLGAPPPSTGP